MKKLITILMTAGMLCGLSGCWKKEARNVPYATFGDAQTAMQDDPIYNPVTENTTVLAACSKDGRYYQVTGTLSEEEKKEMDSLDVFRDDYDEKRSGLLAGVKITEAFDFTDRILSADQCAAYAGKQVQALKDDGFTISGWFFSNEGASVFADKDNLQYTAEVILPASFDYCTVEVTDELLAGLEIKGMQFVTPAYLPLNEKTE